MNLELVANKISPTIVLDIGANQGHWLNEAQQVWPNAYYFCIEGNPQCELALSQTNATYQIAVLSDTVKTVTFHTLKDAGCATGASYYRENTNFYKGDKAIQTEVETTTLDIACEPINFEDSIVLLKLDTQGSELDVLKGGERVLAKTNGILIELAEMEYNEGAPKGTEVDQYLREKGFAPELDLGPITHPITQQIVQRDWYYGRQ